MMKDAPVNAKKEVYELTDPTNHTIVELALEANLLSVNDFDDSFSVALLIHTIFYDPTIKRSDVIHDEQNDPGMFVRAQHYTGFVPDLTILNTISSTAPSFKKTVRINERTGAVMISFGNTLSIGETLEFSKFPFDRQLFRIKIISANSQLGPWKHDLKLLSFNTEAGQASDDNGFSVTGMTKQWDIKGITVTYNPGTNLSYSINLSEPTFTLNVKAERMPLFYFFNYVFIVYIIGSGNVALITFDPFVVAGRNGNVLTLLLAMVSFKFVMISDTPRVNYMTYFDRYIRTAFLLIMFYLLVDIVVSVRFLCMISGHTNRDGCDQQMVWEVYNLDIDNFEFWLVITSWLIWTIYHAMIFIVVLKPTMIMRSWKALYNGEQTLIKTPIQLSSFAYNELSKTWENTGKRLLGFRNAKVVDQKLESLTISN